MESYMAWWARLYWRAIRRVNPLRFPSFVRKAGAKAWTDAYMAWKRGGYA